MEYITIKGARVNNLKNISLKIPRDRITVITGVSGSGKSSLAFDTLYAEGQRRFAESLSSFARQFIGRLAKPNVESISGIPPAIAIEQKVSLRNPRSTVGTTTEVYDYLRLLFAKIGRTYSPISGVEVKCESTEDVLSYISSLSVGKVFILVRLQKSEDEGFIERLLDLKSSGYTRIFCEGEAFKIDDVIKEIDTFCAKNLYLIVSLFTHCEGEDKSEIRSFIEGAFSYGNGYMSVASESGIKDFSKFFEADGMLFEIPTELMFSFNNPLGACPECNGYGSREGIDEKLVIPNASLSVYEDCVAPWRGKFMGWFKEELIANASKFGFPIHRPYASLTQKQKELLWNGNEYFNGINDFFKWVESKRYKVQYKYMLTRYSGKTTCHLCGGGRLRKEALYVKIGGKDIVELLDMSIRDLILFFDNLKLTDYEAQVASRPLAEIRRRLEYIEHIGLGYLTLSRHSNTLSGGESQRINLVSALAGNLVGALYILDEPSIGMHPRDTARLIEMVKMLRDRGNTVVIVEHDANIIRSADYLIDIGPLAGVNGGEVVYQGVPPTVASGSLRKSFSKCGSLTLDYLSGARKIEVEHPRRNWRYSIKIEGAMEHNLKEIDVEFPLNVFTVVTGVSGSGKSSLVGDILYPALSRHFQVVAKQPGAFRCLSGDLSRISGVEYVGQNPMGKSDRSNPVTYLKIYDEIRKLFSDQPLAKLNGYSNAFFSFNIDGGRCPVCLGDGYITVPMQFMADVRMVCEECGGRRFKSDILEVKYHGKNISDVLSMPVDSAIEFFSSQKEPGAGRVVEGLKILQRVGLGYVELGQSCNTLSGGESQRLMLAKFLMKAESNNGSGSFLIFDEPTTGLHFNDIKKLLQCFNAIVDAGNTILVVEHNTDVIRAADWIIDLGPDSGERGGEVVFTGTPDALAMQPQWKRWL